MKKWINRNTIVFGKHFLPISFKRLPTVKKNSGQDKIPCPVRINHTVLLCNRPWTGSFKTTSARPGLTASGVHSLHRFFIFWMLEVSLCLVFLKVWTIKYKLIGNLLNPSSLPEGCRPMPSRNLKCIFFYLSCHCKSERSVLALKMGPFRWGNYSPIFLFLSLIWVP